MKNYTRQYGDDLCAGDIRLKYVWNWIRIASGVPNTKKWTHFQTSEACAGKHWDVSATQWGRKTGITYEARIAYMGEKIEGKDGFRTRVEAQVAAEKMLREWIETQYKIIQP